jgi:hypothetical protein
MKKMPNGLTGLNVKAPTVKQNQAKLRKMRAFVEEETRA